MTDLTIDARGLACPEPVLRVRRALAETAATAITVLVDDDAPAENVARLARLAGCDVSLEQRADHVAVVLARAAGAAGPAEAALATCGGGANVVVLLAADTVGHGDDQLGRLLAIAFVKALKSVAPRPRTIVLMNAGVKLAAEGSELVEALRELEAGGVELLACGTCLDFFHLKEALRAGRVSNMFEIASRLVAADRVVRP